jgi:hypothetical protein
MAKGASKKKSNRSGPSSASRSDPMPGVMPDTSYYHDPSLNISENPNPDESNVIGHVGSPDNPSTTITPIPLLSGPSTRTRASLARQMGSPRPPSTRPGSAVTIGRSPLAQTSPIVPIPNLPMSYSQSARPQAESESTLTVYEPSTATPVATSTATLTATSTATSQAIRSIMPSTGSFLPTTSTSTAENSTLKVPPVIPLSVIAPSTSVDAVLTPSVLFSDVAPHRSVESAYTVSSRECEPSTGSGIPSGPSVGKMNVHRPLTVVMTAVKSESSAITALDGVSPQFLKPPSSESSLALTPAFSARSIAPEPTAASVILPSHLSSVSTLTSLPSRSSLSSNIANTTARYSPRLQAAADTPLHYPTPQRTIETSSLLLSGSQPRDGTSDVGGEQVFKAVTFSSGRDRHRGEVGGGDEVEHPATQHAIMASYHMHTPFYPDNASSSAPINPYHEVPDSLSLPATFARNTHLEPSKLATSSSLPSQLLPTRNVHYSPRMNASISEPLPHELNANAGTSSARPLNPPGLPELTKDVVQELWDNLYEAVPVDSINILSSLYHSLHRVGKGDTIAACMSNLLKKQQIGESPSNYDHRLQMADQALRVENGIRQGTYSHPPPSQSTIVPSHSNTGHVSPKVSIVEVPDVDSSLHNIPPKNPHRILEDESDVDIACGHHSESNSSFTTAHSEPTSLARGKLDVSVSSSSITSTTSGSGRSTRGARPSPPHMSKTHNDPLFSHNNYCYAPGRNTIDARHIDGIAFNRYKLGLDPSDPATLSPYDRECQRIDILRSIIQFVEHYLSNHPDSTEAQYDLATTAKLLSELRLHRDEQYEIREKKRRHLEELAGEQEALRIAEEERLQKEARDCILEAEREKLMCQEEELHRHRQEQMQCAQNALKDLDDRYAAERQRLESEFHRMDDHSQIKIDDLQEKIHKSPHIKQSDSAIPQPTLNTSHVTFPQYNNPEGLPHGRGVTLNDCINLQRLRKSELREGRGLSVCDQGIRFDIDGRPIDLEDPKNLTWEEDQR